MSLMQEPDPVYVLLKVTDGKQGLRNGKYVGRRSTLCRKAHNAKLS